ncbi:MAG: hypothetical protein ACTSUE_10520 [Promethearchaeota archaeon]
MARSEFLRIRVLFFRELFYKDKEKNLFEEKRKSSLVNLSSKVE